MSDMRTYWTWSLEDFHREAKQDPDVLEEFIQILIRRYERLEPHIGAYLHFDPETTLNELKQQSVKNVSPLSGIPIAIKDNICVKGFPTTCASKILEGFRAPYDATAVSRLRTAGSIYFGKTNLDEFAMGSSTENSAYKVTRNPWDRARVPGGSSGGSAAAVAAGMTFWALGSDTGGSVRQPAALCGVVGIKPTYGRVSRYGLVAFASSLDVIGVLTRRVWDNALILHTIAGVDERDQTSADAPVFDLESIRSWERKTQWRLGVPREYFAEGLDPATHEVIKRVLDRLACEGCELIELELPHTEYAIATYYVICTAEASSNLARYDGVRYGLRARSPHFREMYARTRARGFGDEVKRRIMLGTFALSAGYYDAYYLTGLKVRRLIAEDFAHAFQQVDLILGPTSPSTAWKLGEKLDDPLKMYLSDVYTVPASLAGLPALSVPVGQDANGLPVGLQIIGPHFSEDRLYRFAMMIESLFPFYQEVPNGVAEWT